MLYQRDFVFNVGAASVNKSSTLSCRVAWDPGGPRATNVIVPSSFSASPSSSPLDRVHRSRPRRSSIRARSPGPKGRVARERNGKLFPRYSRRGFGYGKVNIEFVCTLDVGASPSGIAAAQLTVGSYYARHFGVYRNRNAVSQRLSNDESVVRCVGSPGTCTHVRVCARASHTHTDSVYEWVGGAVEVAPPTEHEFQRDRKRLSSCLRQLARNAQGN